MISIIAIIISIAMDTPIAVIPVFLFGRTVSVVLSVLSVQLHTGSTLIRF